MKKTLYIFRHGETSWNKAKRFQGHTDIDINETGISQANELKNSLSNRKIELLLSSDLKRARSTAEIVTSELNIPKIYTKELREAHLGEAQGKTHQEAEEIWGEGVVRRWLASTEDFSFPGGEKKSEATSRAKNYINKMLQETEVQNIAISTHGALILRLISELTGKSPAEITVPNGSFFEVEVDENFNWILK